MKFKMFVAVRGMKVYVGGGIYPCILNRGTRRRLVTISTCWLLI